MEDFEEMDFGEEKGKAMGDETKDRLKNRLNALSKTENYCRAIVTDDFEESDSDFGEGARGILLQVEGTRETYCGCTFTKEEYELLCKSHNVSSTLVGTTVEVILSNGLILAIF